MNPFVPCSTFKIEFTWSEPGFTKVCIIATSPELSLILTNKCLANFVIFHRVAHLRFNLVGVKNRAVHHRKMCSEVKKVNHTPLPQGLL